MSLSKGRSAEQCAEQFLKSKNLTLITKNFFCKFGEIDLIMTDGNDIVFVEVRARKNSSYGTAAESISSSKQNKICKSAQVFLHQNDNYQNMACRFDVVELNNFECPEQSTEWLKDAFWPKEPFSIL